MALVYTKIRKRDLLMTWLGIHRKKLRRYLVKELNHTGWLLTYP